MRLIDADKLKSYKNTIFPINRITEYYLLGAKDVLEYVDSMPTVDAVPVKHGKWIGKNIGDEHYDYCSECRYIEWNSPNNYCPNCGARMDKERKEE